MPEPPLDDEDDEEAEEAAAESQQEAEPGAELPPGNLWTRIMDFKDFDENKLIVFSVEDDLEHYSYS